MKSQSIKKGEKKWLKDFAKNKVLLVLCIPMMIYIFIFNYIPMIGAVVAFKRFRYDLGFWKSPWVGFSNFKFFFNTPDAWRITRNTIAYSTVFIVVGTILAVVLALLLFEIRSKIALKFYQTTMFFPHFLSWVVVAYITYAFLNPRSGMINQWFEVMGWEKLNWYHQEKPWIYILPLANTWKTIGYSTLIYYACLMGVDPTYLEAAAVEGANKWQITTKITLPFLYPLITMLTILAIGKIFNADFGLFYQLPMNSPMLYATTDVIETYTFRVLREMGNIDMSSAAGLYQSFVGFVLVIFTNYIVRRRDPDNSLF